MTITMRHLYQRILKLKQLQILWNKFVINDESKIWSAHDFNFENNLPSVHDPVVDWRGGGVVMVAVTVVVVAVIVQRGSRSHDDGNGCWSERNFKWSQWTFK